MKKSGDFEKAVSSYIAELKKVKKTLDLSHLPELPAKISPKKGIPLNQALSYIEAASALVDKASENLKEVLS